MNTIDVAETTPSGATGYFLTPDLSQRLDLVSHLLANTTLIPYIQAAEGCGKTRLARHLADSLADHYTVSLVSGGSLAQVSDLRMALADISGIPADSEVSDDLLEEQFCQLAERNRHLLLLLDDADQLDNATLSWVLGFFSGQQQACQARCVVFSAVDVLALPLEPNQLATLRDASQVLDVPPFNANQLRGFVDHIRSDDADELTDAQLASLMKQTGGIPGKVLWQVQFADLQQQQTPAQGRPEPWLKPLVIAAAAVFLISVGLIVLFQDEINQFIASDSTEEPVQGELQTLVIPPQPVAPEIITADTPIAEQPELIQSLPMTAAAPDFVEPAELSADMPADIPVNNPAKIPAGINDAEPVVAAAAEPLVTATEEEQAADQITVQDTVQQQADQQQPVDITTKLPAAKEAQAAAEPVTKPAPESATGSTNGSKPPAVVAGQGKDSPTVTEKATKQATGKKPGQAAPVTEKVAAPIAQVPTVSEKTISPESSAAAEVKADIEVVSKPSTATGAAPVREAGTTIAPAPAPKSASIPEPKPEPVASQGSYRSLQWLYDQAKPGSYTLQLLAVSERAGIDRFVSQLGLKGDLVVLPTERDNKPWFALLYGVFPDREAAIKARKQLPGGSKTGAAWPRTIESVRQSAVPKPR